MWCRARKRIIWPCAICRVGRSPRRVSGFVHTVTDASVPIEHLACSPCLTHVVSVAPSTSRAHGFSHESESRQDSTEFNPRLERSSGRIPSDRFPRDSSRITRLFGATSASSDPARTLRSPPSSTELTATYETHGFLANPHGALRSTAGPVAVNDPGSFGFRVQTETQLARQALADVRFSPRCLAPRWSTLLSTPRLSCLSYVANFRISRIRPD